MKEMEYEAKEFTMRVVQECMKLDPNGKIFIVVGEKRNIRRSISDDYIDIIVLNEKEKRFIENIVNKNRFQTRSFAPQTYGERNSSIGTATNTKRNYSAKGGISETITNMKGKTTQEAIRSTKTQNKKKKRTLKNRVKKMTKKVYEMIPKTKEFIKKNGNKVGVGITALALMGIIASTELKERAENIQIYNSEYTSVEQVEEKMKSIIDIEIRKAVDGSEYKPYGDIKIHIDRLKSYRDMSEGVEIIIDGSKTYGSQLSFSERKGWDSLGGNIPEGLEEMAESYLQVQEMSDSNMTNGKKNKAIKLLKKVEELAEKKEFVIKKSKFPNFLRSTGNDYVIKELREDRDER